MIYECCKLHLIVLKNIGILVFFQVQITKKYKTEIKKFKKYAYAAIGLDYNTSQKCIEVPILPHVMKGLLRRYFMKMNINMKEDTIKTIFEIFDGDRITKMSHKEIIKIELLCDSL